MNPIVEIEHLSFGYGAEPVLEDISLTVEQGDILGLIGPNGSGKTTLLKLILGVLEPQRGTIPALRARAVAVSRVGADRLRAPAQLGL
jgi:zinc transport system ATP-binding protein